MLMYFFKVQLFDHILYHRIHITGEKKDQMLITNSSSLLHCMIGKMCKLQLMKCVYLEILILTLLKAMI